MDADYKIQAAQKKTKFVERGYSGTQLDRTIEEVGTNSQELCLQSTVRDRNSIHEWGFITNFNAQHKEIETIIQQHWEILRMDKVLGKVIPVRPSFIYRRGPTFGDQVVQKIIDPPKRPSMFWQQMKGFFACRRCRSCSQVRHHLRGLTTFTSPANGCMFDIKSFITCQTTHVVYAMKCPCDLIYIGRTKRSLTKRISEHITNIKNGMEEHSVPLHFKNKHQQDPSQLLFWGIETVDPQWRGSNRVRDLSKRETNWIFLTDSLQPKGLNVDLDINAFISNY